MKKFSFAVAIAIVVVGLSISGLSQQRSTYKVKHSAPEKAPKSAPMGKMASPGTASSSNSRDLQSIERQTAKSSATTSHSAPKKTGTASSVKPVKDKSSPPSDFSVKGGGKKTGTVTQSRNPYKGRLKQKGPQ
jgi:hypothetical protein